MNDTSTTTRHGVYYAGPTGAADEIAPTPSLFHTMFVDGVEHTADDVRDLKAEVKRLEEEADRWRETNRRLNDERHHFTASVRSAFTELVDDGDLDKSKANEVLVTLNIDPLPTKYRATVTVEFEVTFESTEDEVDAESALRDATFEMYDPYSSQIEGFEVADTNVGDISVEVDE